MCLFYSVIADVEGVLDDDGYRIVTAQVLSLIDPQTDKLIRASVLVTRNVVLEDTIDAHYQVKRSERGGRPMS